MRKLHKGLVFTLILTILLLTTTTLSAVDVNDTSDNIIAQSDSVIDDAVSTPVKTDKNIEKTAAKTVKNDEEYTGITVNQNNFPSYFDSNGYTKSDIANNSNLRFDGTINLNQNIVIDKALNITAINNGKIQLNTNSFTISNAGSNTNITGLDFYNTQIYVDNAENVVLNEIDVTTENQNLGWGVGVTSIRDGSFNITVANSTFTTTNNGGSSTLVLADANNCTIDHNTITAEGNVGNLIYLTTYNLDSNPSVDYNSYNVIKNNVLTGPTTSTSICWGIVLSGHNNTVDNNTINYDGIAITTQAINVVDEFNFENDISVNNSFTYNRINNMGLFMSSEYSTVIGNNFTGSVVIGENSKIEYNKIPNAFNVRPNSEVNYNQFNNNVIINDNTLFTYNNVTGLVTINDEDNTIDYNNIAGDLSIAASDNDLSNNNLSIVEISESVSNINIEYNNIDSLIFNGNNDYNNIIGNNITELILLGESSYNTISYNTIDYLLLDKDTSFNTVTNNNIGFLEDNGNDNIINSNNPIDNNQNINKKTLKQDDEYQIIHLNNSNFNNYYRISNNRIVSPQTTVPRNGNVILIFDEVIDNLTLYSIPIRSNPEFIVTSNPNVTFRNVKFSISPPATCNFKLVNMSFEFDGELDTRIQTSFFPLELYGNGNGNATLDNITVKADIKSDDFTYYDEDADDFYQEIPQYLIVFNSTATMKNSNINISCFASTVDWDDPTGTTYGKTNLLPFYVAAKNNTEFELYNTTIFINTTETVGSYPTTYGLDLHTTSTVVGNNITMVAGEGWSYAIHPTACSAYIAENIIDVTGINYTAGVGLENPFNCVVNNNTIIVNSSLEEQIYDGSTNEYCAYAIFINDYGYMGGKLNTTNSRAYNNTIINNHIIGNAYNTYAIEEFGGKDTLIANNTIEIPNSNTAMGIGAIAHNITIADNNITINGTNITGGTVDYLGAMTTGIYLARVGNSTVYGNIINSTKLGMYLMNEDNDLIENNTITTDYENAIYLQRVNNSIIKNNYLESQELKGNKAVIDNNGNNNVIENNLPEIKEYSLKVDTTEFTVGTNATISASIYLSDDMASDINKGKVVFKVNGKTLKDANGKIIYAKVVNGTATIPTYEIPESWAKENITIEASLIGCSESGNLKTNKTTITVTSQEPTLTTEDITATANGTITLKANIISDDSTINTGKIVFKINGKTVKDENGKVIYAQVINNTVSIEYTLPETYKTGNYTITATFIGKNIKLEDKKTLIITA